MNGLRWAGALVLVALGFACGGGGSTHEEGAGVGPGGGTVSRPGGPSLVVPAGALDVTTNIVIAESTSTPPAGAITKVFTFEPAGTTFASPVRVSFPVPAGTLAQDVSVYWTKPGASDQWEPLPTTVSSTTASADVSHFSSGFVGAACTAGVACVPANACETGTRTCNGTPACESTGESVTDGTDCGSGNVCLVGTCKAPFLARANRVTPPSGASYLQTNVVTAYDATTYTRKVENEDGSSVIQTWVIDGHAISLAAVTNISAAGSATTTTYSPPALYRPASSAPGATESSTSTVTTGGQTSTQVRQLTVDGVETVTVPAGELSALKVTTVINGTSYLVVWWVPGAAAKVQTYAAATPAAVTTTEMLGTTPMACTGGTCDCNGLDSSSAPLVSRVTVTADPPAQSGGTTVDGTYSMTTYNLHAGDGCPGCVPNELRWSLGLGGGAVQSSIWSSMLGRESRNSGVFTTSGTRFTITPTCGGSFGRNFLYTATGDQLHLVQEVPPGEYAPEMIFTRQ